MSDFFRWDSCIFSIKGVFIPPRVSIPNVSGVTSSNRTSFTSPLIIPPWMAAPNDTASSGWTDLSGDNLVISLTISWTFGIRVLPPTKITLSICLTLASLIACFVVL